MGSTNRRLRKRHKLGAIKGNLTHDFTASGCISLYWIHPKSGNRHRAILGDNNEITEVGGLEVSNQSRGTVWVQRQNGHGRHGMKIAKALG